MVFLGEIINMFFAHKVKSIKKTDRVLEIGPGGTPHERADVFLDLDPKYFKDDDEALYQRGAAPPLKTDKPIVYYDGKNFPFKDKEFDYVICSHVIEHVEDIAAFVKELFRITDKGYIEFPTILYDYIYDIPVHPNFVYYDKKDRTLRWLKKAQTNFSDFKDVQHFFFVSVAKGHESLIQSLEKSMMQGFEWFEPFKIKKATSISQLVPPTSGIQKARVLAPLNPPVISAQDSEKAITEYHLKEMMTELKIRAKRRTKRKIGKYIPVPVKKQLLKANRKLRVRK